VAEPPLGHGRARPRDISVGICHTPRSFSHNRNAKKVLRDDARQTTVDRAMHALLQRLRSDHGMHDASRRPASRANARW